MEYDDIEELPGGHHIRILSLSPSENLSDPIHIQLSTVKLADEPKFVALSYCWGDATDKLPIVCNGQEFLVTRNLDSALRHVRDDEKERILWIDAICINQNSISERSYQVSLMQTIYRIASAVIVWLGDADADSDLVFPLCEKMAETRLDLVRDLKPQAIWSPDREKLLKESLAKAKKRKAKTEQEAVETSHPSTVSDVANPSAQVSEGDGSLNDDVADDEVDVSDASDEEVSAFLRLIARPWFTRCWVLQEVCLAKEAVLLCSSQAIFWDVFYAGFFITILLSEKGTRGRPEQLYRTALFLIGQLRPKVIDTDTPYQGVGLLWLLRKVLPLNATDLHDKIYAVLGLLGAEESQEMKLVPDYTLSVEECFQTATLAIMSRLKNLDVLIHDHHSHSKLDLPSWVPDWSFLPTPSPISLDPDAEDIYGERPNRRHVCASLSTLWTPVVKDGKTLVVSGYDFDEIIEVEDILTVPPVDHTDIADMATSMSNFTGLVKKIFVGLGSYFDTLVKWEKLALSSKYAAYPSGEDPETVFAITLCTGNIESQEDTLQQFQKWRKTLRGPRKIAFLKNLGIHGGFYKSMVAAVGIGSGISNVDDRVYATATEMTLFRRLARTKKGYLAVVPSQSAVGDHVALYKGSKMPFIVRHRHADSKRVLLGPCYVHGIMYGEAWDETLCEAVEII